MVEQGSLFQYNAVGGETVIVYKATFAAFYKMLFRTAAAL